MHAFWMVWAAFLFASMGVCIKAAAPYFSPGEMVFYRGLIGMLLMFAFLRIRGEVGQPISEAATALLRYLPLLLVPPAVGVMVYTRQIAADFWALAGALGLSLLISLVFAGWLMQRLIERQSQRSES